MPETMTRLNLGWVAGALAEQLAYLNSPAQIHHEIARLEVAINGGDTSEATRVLLRDRQAVRRAQRRLVVGDGEGETEALRPAIAALALDGAWPGGVQ